MRHRSDITSCRCQMPGMVFQARSLRRPHMRKLFPSTLMQKMIIKHTNWKSSQKGPIALYSLSKSRSQSKSQSKYFQELKLYSVSNPFIVNLLLYFQEVTKVLNPKEMRIHCPRDVLLIQNQTVRIKSSHTKFTEDSCGQVDVKKEWKDTKLYPVSVYR